MVEVTNLVKGLRQWVDLDVLPKLTGLKKMALGGYVTLAADNAPAVVSRYLHHPMVEVLGVVGEGEQVDVDKLYNVFLPYFANGARQSMHIPLVGELYLDKNDLDKVYTYVREVRV